MEAAVDIHVFHCGQGDTLLLRLDHVKWALIDCHLPNATAVESFLAELDAMGVTRLDLLCLTHPDRDHYCGMLRVLKYFTTAPRSVGAFCDAGFCGKLVMSGAMNGEICEIYKCVISLCENGELRYKVVYADTQNLESDWLAGMVPISPESSRISFENIGTILDITVPMPNEYSMVLVIESGLESDGFRGLLPGDAGGETLTIALEHYRAKRPISARAPQFDFVKIAHHGSWRSHEKSPMCKTIRMPGKSTAVASTSSKSGRLPRREVLQDYLNHGWQVYDTGRRQEPTEAGRFANVQAWTESVESKYNVKVSWSPTKGLETVPEEARVENAQLGLYPAGRPPFGS